MENFYYERPVVWKLFHKLFESQYCCNYKCILSEFWSVVLTVNKKYAVLELARDFVAMATVACETQFSATTKDMYLRYTASHKVWPVRSCYFLRKCPSNCFIVNMIAMKHLNFIKMFGKYNEILEI